VTEAFKKIYEQRKCEKLQADKGSEFYNKEFLTFCKTNKIQIYSTQSELKAAVVNICIVTFLIQLIINILMYLML
jgi:hypothetical protein